MNESITVGGTCARCGRQITIDIDPETREELEGEVWSSVETLDSCIPGPNDEDRYHGPVIEIVDAMPGAVKVRASEIKPGDSFYDAVGGTHKIARVRELKRHRKFTREDGWVDYFAPTDIVTIKPQEA